MSADFRVVAGAVVVATVAASWLLLQCQSSAFAFAADGVALGFLPALAFNTTLAFDRVVGHAARFAVGELAIEIVGPRRSRSCGFWLLALCYNTLPRRKSYLEFLAARKMLVQLMEL